MVSIISFGTAVFATKTHPPEHILIPIFYWYVEVGRSCRHAGMSSRGGPPISTLRSTTTDGNRLIVPIATWRGSLRKEALPRAQQDRIDDQFYRVPAELFRHSTLRRLCRDSVLYLRLAHCSSFPSTYRKSSRIAV